MKQFTKRNKQKYLENRVLKVFLEAYFFKLNQKNNITNEQWELNLCELQWKTSSSTLWKEFSWKNLIRFFITPFQKCHYINDHQTVWAVWGESLCILVLPIVDSLLAGGSWGLEKSFPCGHSVQHSALLLLNVTSHSFQIISVNWQDGFNVNMF